MTVLLMCFKAALMHIKESYLAILLLVVEQCDLLICMMNTY